MSEEKYRNRQERKRLEKNNEHKSNKLAKKGSMLKKVFISCLVLFVLSVGIGVISIGAMMKKAPKLDPSKLVDPLSTKFYDKNGNFLFEYGKENRTKITYAQVPKTMEHAFIATEDAHFYEHGGIDIKGTVRAIFENLTGHFGSQGGSTITQQVIKNTFLTPQKTITRKVQEWSLASQLEKKYSKQEILMMYLNKIYLGDGSYGVAAAAKTYYGIDANHLNELTLPEEAMLAGLPQGPSIYDPTQPENKKAATDRRNVVLSSMYKQRYITKKQMQEAKKVPVTAGLVPNTNHHGMPYEVFLDAAVREVKGKLKNVDISTDGLSIYTTLDPKAQDYADKMMDTNSIVSYPNGNFQGAFVFLDTKTGEVRAIGSGRNDYKASFLGNNFAIDMKRQPGSSFKPIFDYGPAIENLEWSTGHQLNDQKTTYSNGQPISNWDHQYHGKLSIRTALQYSYNIPALLTLRAVGMDKAKSFAENLGITFDHNTVYESNAIGSNTVNPLEMAGAYSAFGNNGVYNTPHLVSKVVFPNGKVMDFTPKPKQVMHEYTAYMITDMLRTVVNSGTGKAAMVPGLDVAGKTGTTNFDDKTSAQFGYPSNATNDSWFAGYTPQYTMAVWTGYAKNGPGNYMLGDTTKISQLMFKNMMQALGTDKSSFQQPSSVYKVNNELYIKGGDSAEVPPKQPSSDSKSHAKSGNKKADNHKQGNKKNKPKDEKHNQADNNHKPKEEKPKHDDKHKQKEEKHNHG
ncbi:transglycosylase domain-containing protein [Heyndrickxia acidicola]|uniref:PBP1A family penicillin-binding protein n=1 Tax=Heyndrickxia acidicola TaxID=209389 RepID=A0ABU6MIE3_9BACI|nr:PBP1A family penicillin-binding protein [Heyndrickxia acidicola]MED1203781.1 PBP1A family penicillin-binding protein [Heyndrickxia acidicola]